MKTFFFSQQGRRSYQEDSLFVDGQTHSLFIVCDGVGGSKSGDLASSSIIKFLSESFLSTNPISKEEKLVQNIFEEARGNLLSLISDYPENEGMATTVALAWFTPKDLVISHLGDSRVYIIKPSTNAYWRTKDHSLVQELYDAGILKTEADMLSHPMKNRITGAISSSAQSDVTDPSITRFDDLDPGDMIILCSDGVLEAFPNQEFIEILMDETTTLEEKGKSIQMECELKSIDNNTCIILELEDGEGYSSGSNAGVEFRKLG